MDDLNHPTLACGGAPPPRSDVQELLVLGGGEGPWRGPAGKNAVGFGHVAPDEAGGAVAGVVGNRGGVVSGLFNEP